MNGFIATIIGSSVISSFISSMSSNNNNKYSNRFKAKLNIQLERIKSLRNDLSEYISECFKIQYELNDKSSDEYNKSKFKVRFLSNKMASTLGVPNTGDMKDLDILNYLKSCEKNEKHQSLNKNNKSINRDIQSTKSSNLIVRYRLVSYLFATNVCYSHKNNYIDKYGRGCRMMLNSLRDYMGSYLRKQEDILTKPDLSNSKKAKFFIINLYNKSYIKNNKVLKFMYSTFIVISLLFLILLPWGKYLTLFPWIKAIWNVDLIYQFLSIFSLFVIIHIYYCFRKNN